MLTKYDSLGASSRMRMLQYIPSLEEEGIQVTTSPLFSNTYIEELQNNQRKIFKIFVAYLSRIKSLILFRDFDLLWIEKECFPWVPAWIEKIFLPKKIPFIIDFDDAVFHVYDLHASKIIKYCLGQKHSSLIKGAASVTVGNEYLFNYARNHFKDKITIIPTVVDLNKYQKKTYLRDQNQEKIIVGWIGQQSTAYNLKPLEIIFNELADNQNIEFIAIGIDAVKEGISMKSVQWTSETEVEELSNFSIGIMPLNDGLFEKGKCGFKLIQYMALGIPVIASPVGVNSEIVAHNENGFLVQNLDEWREALTALINNPSLRNQMGRAGQNLIKEKYCIEVTQQILVQLFKDTINKSK